MGFIITGVIHEIESLRPVPGLLVRAYDKDPARIKKLILVEGIGENGF